MHLFQKHSLCSPLPGNQDSASHSGSASQPSSNSTSNSRSRSKREVLLLVLKGMAMGAADVVPGVSGGTIAFISGIYEELINSLRSINFSALSLLFRRGPAAAWQAINGNFLIAVFGGILLSLISVSRVISYCLANYPIHVWSFFFGLIIASIIYIASHWQSRTWKEWLAFAVGAAIALAISNATPSQLPAEAWILFLAGMVAICAMILPGISGSFILLLLGLYSVFLNALKEFDVVLLLSFAGGCACGLLSFSHFLAWLLKRFHSMTMAVLTGFLLGSLQVIWPWKQVLEIVVGRNGKEIPILQKNLAPWEFEQITGNDSHVWFAVLLAVVGVALVLGLERLGAKQTPNLSVRK